jgi:hypothetical protein
MILLRFQRRKHPKIFREVNRANRLACDFRQVAATTLQQPTGTVSDHPSSYVLLNKGFDGLLVLLIQFARHLKTICFYEYWGAVEGFVSGTESLAPSSI